MIHFPRSFVMKKTKYPVSGLKLVLLTSVLALSACSTITEGSQQQITFETPNAYDALCEVKLGTHGLVYAVRPPQTLWIKRTARNMYITCEAPGNRIVKKEVSSEVAATSFLNVFNGIVPGTAYDADTGAMFKFPEKIEIDFSGVEAVAAPMPNYHNKDGLDPKQAASIEDYGPDTPAAHDDAAISVRHAMAYADAEREAAAQAALEAERQSRINSLEGGFYGDKGNIGNK